MHSLSLLKKFALRTLSAASLPPTLLALETPTSLPILPQLGSLLLLGRLPLHRRTLTLPLQVLLLFPLLRQEIIIEANPSLQSSPSQTLGLPTLDNIRLGNLVNSLLHRKVVSNFRLSLPLAS